MIPRFLSIARLLPGNPPLLISNYPLSCPTTHILNSKLSKADLLAPWPDLLPPIFSTQWQLHPPSFTKNFTVILDSSFSHFPHPVCWKILLALSPKYVQDLTTSHHLPRDCSGIDLDYKNGLLTGFCFCLCPFQTILNTEVRIILLKCRLGSSPHDGLHCSTWFSPRHFSNLLSSLPTALTSLILLEHIRLSSASKMYLLEIFFLLISSKTLIKYIFREVFPYLFKTSNCLKTPSPFLALFSP